MQVQEIMIRDVALVTVDTPIDQALDEMKNHDVDFLPVILANVCVGTLSRERLEETVLRAGLDPAKINAAEVMTRGIGNAEPLDIGSNEAIAAIFEEATPEEATRLMDRIGVKRLAVHNADGNMIGIISRSDIEAAQARDLASLASDE